MDATGATPEVLNRNFNTQVKGIMIEPKRHTTWDTDRTNKSDKHSMNRYNVINKCWAFRLGQ